MNNMIDDARIYYCPGDVVMIKHDLDNRPKMMVVEKVSRNIISKDGNAESVLLGIKCRWFDKSMKLCEAVFSTKDLMKV